MRNGGSYWSKRNEIYDHFVKEKESLTTDKLKIARKSSTNRLSGIIVCKNNSGLDIETLFCKSLTEVCFNKLQTKGV